MSLGACALKAVGAGQQSGTGKKVTIVTQQVVTTRGTVTLNKSPGYLYQREGGRKWERLDIQQAK